MKNKFPLIMKSAAVFTAAVTILLVLLYHFYGTNRLLVTAISFGTTAYHFIMRLMVGYIVPKVTRYDFDCKHPWFHPRGWETRLYKYLRLKRWKGKLPTYAPEQFSLENNSLHRIIQNMCGAEVVHEIIILLSFLPLLLIPVFGAAEAFWITSLASAAFDCLFVMAQRYNRPRLVRIYKKHNSKAPLTQGSSQKSSIFD